MNPQKRSVTGLIVHASGLASEVTLLPDGGSGHLYGMYQALGCRLVDCVQLTARLDMWLDDEGFFNQDVNLPASYIALRYGFNWQYYHGTVLFLGGPDAEGNCTSLNPDTATALKGMIIEFISAWWDSRRTMPRHKLSRGMAGYQIRRGPYRRTTVEIRAAGALPGVARPQAGVACALQSVTRGFTMIMKPDPAWWDEPKMHRALAGRDISTVYRLLCDDGLTQAQISKLTGQSQSEVSEILNGRKVIFYSVLERIADGLGIPRGHVGLAYADADGNLDAYPEVETGVDSEVDDDMISRRFLGMASAALLGGAGVNGPIMQLGTALLGEEGGLRLLSGPAGRLGKSDVPWIKDMTAKVWDLDLQYGGGAAYGLARGVAEQVVGAVQTSPPNREVQLAASRLCWTAAWSAFDAGRKREFWQIHATALDLAKQAGDIDTINAIVSAAGRAEILSGNHRAAAKLFELVSVRKTPDAVAWGLLGDAYAPNSPESAKSALIQLRNAKGANSLDAQAMTGHVSLNIGDYATAVSAFDRVVSQRTGRLAVQETVPLAIAHLKANETRVGVQHAERAYTLAQKVRSTQCNDALRRLGGTLAAQKNSTAQDLARQILATTA